jgi:hypothetical protein
MDVANVPASEVSTKRRRSMPGWWGGRRIRSSALRDRIGAAAGVQIKLGGQGAGVRERLGHIAGRCDAAVAHMQIRHNSANTLRLSTGTLLPRERRIYCGARAKHGQGHPGGGGLAPS